MFNLMTFPPWLAQAYAKPAGPGRGKEDDSMKTIGSYDVIPGCCPDGKLISQSIASYLLNLQKGMLPCGAMHCAY
jgi:hypothetical protein